MIGWLIVGSSLFALAGCNGFAAKGQNAAGVRAFDRGHYEVAMDQFLEATYTDQSNPDGFYNLAAGHHRIGGQQRRQEELDQAEQYYRMCLERDRDHRDGYRGLAVLLAQQGRSDEAFELIEGWVESHPSSADARIELARLYEEFGDPMVAENLLAEAVEIQPQSARARTALGKIHDDRGETMLAMRNYQQSLQSNAQQPRVASRLALLQSAARGATSTTISGGGTRMVDREPTVLR